VARGWSIRRNNKRDRNNPLDFQGIVDYAGPQLLVHWETRASLSRASFAPDRMTKTIATIAFTLLATVTVASCARAPKVASSPQAWPEVWPVTEMPLDTAAKSAVTDDSDAPTPRATSKESMCWYEAPRAIAAPCPNRVLKPVRY
jgi:hypothetical protein